MLLADSHCHLNFPDFANDLDAVVQAAREQGVGVMQTICTGMAEFDEVLGIAQRYEGIYCSVGVHPNESGKTASVTASELIEKSSYAQVIGLGETGLDYYYETSDRQSQQTSFLAHIQAARETGLPLIVHTRNADDDTIDILTREYAKGAITGVIHCFTSTPRLAQAMLEIGFYISFSGIVTFKNAGQIREALALVPLDRVLVETDAPYLAPVPHRGKRNEPAFVRHTNRVVAELKGITEEECAARTTENFFRLFRRAQPPMTAQCVCA